MVCEGKPIIAADHGWIENNSTDPSNGLNRIIIRHANDWHTLYAHLATRSPLHVGDEVFHGTPIGTCGHTSVNPPTAQNAHIHFLLFHGDWDDSDGVVPIPMDGVTDPVRFTSHHRGFVSTNTADTPSNPFYTYVGQLPGPTTLSTPTPFTLQLRNTGTVTWYRDVTTACNLYLGTGEPGRTDGYHAQDHASPFYQPGAYGWLQNNRIVMTEAIVAPGDTATFTFAANVPDILGAVNEYWTPILEGPGCTTPQWLPSIGIYWHVTVVPFAYQRVDQSPEPFTMTEATWFTVHLQNTGVHTWYRETASDCNVHLATGAFGITEGYEAQDHTSPFYQPGAYGWLNGQRIIMQEEQVPPGGIGTFRYLASLPTTTGEIREYWTPVVEGVNGTACPVAQWLPSIGLYWQATVQPTSPSTSYTLFLPTTQR